MWDQFAWPPSVAIPQALQEAELYGYCCRQVVEMGSVMPAAQFWVTDKVGNYLYVARALAFEGSVLAYNPTRNEVEWVPVWGLFNYIMPAEERSAIALTNYVPCIPKEKAQIMKLGSHQIVNWSGNSSMTEEEGWRRSQ